MIKLPLRLETRSNWKELIGDAILKLKELEGLAEAERAGTATICRRSCSCKHSRFGWESQTVSVEVVESCLIKD